MGPIFNIAWKDVRLLLRDRFGLFWVMAFPFLMALFFGAIFGGGDGSTRSMKIAVVTDSFGIAPSKKADQFYSNLSDSKALQVARMPLDSAKAAVSKGNLVAYVQYTPGTLDDQPFAMFAPEGGPKIEVGIDPSRRAEAGYLQGLISQAYFSQLQDMFANTASWKGQITQQLESLDTSTSIAPERRGRIRKLLGKLGDLAGTIDQLDSSRENTKPDTTAGKQPALGNVSIDFTDIATDKVGPRSSFEITFPQALQWALIGCAASFAISMMVERTRGTYTRLRLAPISRAHILAGKGLACFISSVGVSVLLMLVGALVFNVRVVSPIHLALAICASAFCFVGIMMLISVLGSTERAVAGAGWAIMLVFSMTGGGMVPLMFMPSWMATIGNFSPVKWSVLSYEGAIWRDFTLGDMMTPVIILVSYGLVAFLLGVVILRRSDA